MISTKLFVCDKDLVSKARKSDCETIIGPYDDSDEPECYFDEAPYKKWKCRRIEDLDELVVPEGIGENFFFEAERDESNCYAAIIDKIAIVAIIELVEKRILNWYTKILENGPERCIKEIAHKKELWSSVYKPYNLNPKAYMVQHMDDELCIWNLIEMVRNINWDTETIVMMTC